MAGGEPGLPWVNQLVNPDGSIEVMPAICQRSLEPGDVLVIQTPGGGGYGEAD